MLNKEGIKFTHRNPFVVGDDVDDKTFV
jgi:hypothetical protein